MSFKKWQNVPLKIIPEGDRVKARELAICQGGCNKLSSIHTTPYQLCSTCGNKWRYHGHSCDVPNCEAIADGTIEFNTRENKMLCKSCYMAWSNRDYCVWERFVESRHSWLLRPETFVKALQDGIISPIEKENGVKQRIVAECHHCYEKKSIANAVYQLCSTCTRKLQYHGETCGVCEINDAIGFDTTESIFFCKACQATKNKYNITSYQIYKTQFRTFLNCHVCNITISHDRENGNPRCSAFIDHDHDTNETRGVLCFKCNVVEGLINKMPIDATTYAKNLVEYLENPPLTKSWAQSL
jgi:ribosomal protein S14